MYLSELFTVSKFYMELPTYVVSQIYMYIVQSLLKCDD